MSGGEIKGQAENEKEIENDDQIALPPALKPPADLITRIFGQLDCIDLLHCSLVCKQWYIDSAELREGWKNEYSETCNLFGLGIKRETRPPSTVCSVRDLQSWCP